MNFKMISLETTFKTVHVGSRTDTFGKRVPDGTFGDWERSLAELRRRPWYDVVCAVRGTESALWWAAADIGSCGQCRISNAANVAYMLRASRFCCGLVVPYEKFSTALQDISTFGG